MRVGLWSFEKSSGKIHKLFTPKSSGARSSQAREKAITIMERCLKLGEFPQKLQPFRQRK